MQRRLLLDIVVAQGAAVLEMFAGEDQTLLTRRDALLVLDLRLHGVDGVAGLDLECDGLAGRHGGEQVHGAESRRKVVDLATGDRQVRSAGKGVRDRSRGT